jgi:hypothetical protein
MQCARFVDRSRTWEIGGTERCRKHHMNAIVILVGIMGQFGPSQPAPLQPQPYPTGPFVRAQGTVMTPGGSMFTDITGDPVWMPGGAGQTYDLIVPNRLPPLNPAIVRSKPNAKALARTRRSAPRNNPSAERALLSAAI